MLIVCNTKVTMNVKKENSSCRKFTQEDLYPTYVIRNVVLSYTLEGNNADFLGGDSE